MRAFWDDAFIAYKSKANIASAPYATFSAFSTAAAFSVAWFGLVKVDIT